MRIPNPLLSVLLIFCIAAIGSMMNERCSIIAKQRDQAMELAAKQNQLIQKAADELNRLRMVIDRLEGQVWLLQFERWLRPKPEQDGDDARPVLPREKPLA